MYQAVFYIYRPGQPNWEYIILNFQVFSATQILREINFGHFETPKTAILTIYAALNFEFLQIFAIFKCEFFLKVKIQSLQNCYNGNFLPTSISQN